MTNQLTRSNRQSMLSSILKCFLSVCGTNTSKLLFLMFFLLKNDKYFPSVIMINSTEDSVASSKYLFKEIKLHIIALEIKACLYEGHEMDVTERKPQCNLIRK